jgi:DNA gyrase subunit A
MRGKVTIDTIRRDREAIIITEIPYQVNKAAMIEKMAELVRDKRLDGISDIRDESDRQGMRVVIELKRDAMADVVLNQLYRYTPLQSTFGVNSVALNGGRPEIMTLKDMISAFVAFREEVVTRRTKFLLAKARERAHVLVGLAIAVANIDEVIALIRRSKDAAEARAALMGRAWPAKDMVALINLIADPRHRVGADDTYRLSEAQARAILDLRLQRLTALGREEIAEELEKLGKEIEDYLDILRSRSRVQKIIKDELKAIKDEFATPRRTEIIEQEFEVEDEDLIQREDMVVTVSHAGYIKRVPLSAYRAQRRGGKGRAGMQTREEDFVTKIFVANTHTPVLFFSSTGMVYREKVWRLPVGNPQARGKALINLLPLDPEERITTIMPMPEEEASWGKLQIMFATRSGNVRRNELSDFVDIRRSGKIAMKLEAVDHLAGVEICSEADDVLLTTAKGQCIRFAVGDVRVFKGRDSAGVRGIKLDADDHVISMAILTHVEALPEERAAFLRMRRAQQGDEIENGGEEGEETVTAAPLLNEERFTEMLRLEQCILTVSANGFGKRSSSYEYRVTGRGGKGIVAMIVNKRNGELVASFPVKESDEIMLVSDGGQLIRCPVHDIRIAGRSTQGVTIFDMAEDEHVVSVEHIPEEAEETAEAAGPVGASSH